MTNESHLTMCVRHYIEYEINFSVDLLTTPYCLSSARLCSFCCSVPSPVAPLRIPITGNPFRPFSKVLVDKPCVRTLSTRSTTGQQARWLEPTGLRRHRPAAARRASVSSGRQRLLRACRLPARDLRPAPRPTLGEGRRLAPAPPLPAPAPPPPAPAPHLPAPALPPRPACGCPPRRVCCAVRLCSTSISRRSSTRSSRWAVPSRLCAAATIA